jgi:hypothetical protein
MVIDTGIGGRMGKGMIDSCLEDSSLRRKDSYETKLYLGPREKVEGLFVLVIVYR